MDKIDLHNDLLNYLLRSAERTPYDSELNCSVAEMITGGIRFQVLPAFSLQPNNPIDLVTQFNAYLDLVQSNESVYGEICYLWAIENAQQLLGPCSFGDTIEEKLFHFSKHSSSPVYISLTWIDENDFGGGDRTNIGLKDRGRNLIDIIADTTTAIDISHASDRLVDDIIDYREKNNLTLNIIASHSNFRKIHPVPRNLTDEVALYILRNQGLIGLCFSKNQLGTGPTLNVQDHYEYALALSKDLSTVLCLGGDMYYEKDLPEGLRKSTSIFHESLSKSSDYNILNTYPKSLLFDNAYRYLSANNFLPVIK